MCTGLDIVGVVNRLLVSIGWFPIVFRIVFRGVFRRPVCVAS